MMELNLLNNDQLRNRIRCLVALWSFLLALWAGIAAASSGATVLDSLMVENDLISANIRNEPLLSVMTELASQVGAELLVTNSAGEKKVSAIRKNVGAISLRSLDASDNHQHRRKKNENN